ncbi:MAG: hypothetical protein PVH41_02265 [Anaerolineae bacterium]|jgi:ASC-1-like (ASCH) protein
MVHIVYVREGSKELRQLINGKRTMIVRGDSVVDAAHRRVRPGDTLHFAVTSDHTTRLRATVSKVQHSHALKKKEALVLLEAHQPWTRLTETEMVRWADCRYLSLMTLDDVRQIPPRPVSRGEGRQEGDWLLVDDEGQLAGTRRESPWLAGKRVPKEWQGGQLVGPRKQVLD